MLEHVVDVCARSRRVGEGEARRRILGLWRRGASLFVLADVGWLLVLAEPTTWRLLMTVPTLPVGTYQVVASDSLGNSISSTFTINPARIVATPSSGAAGSVVSLSGSGFSCANYSYCNALTVTLYVMTRTGTGAGTPATLVGSPVVQTDGTFTASFTVPAGLTSGTYQIAATRGPAAYLAFTIP